MQPSSRTNVDSEAEFAISALPLVRVLAYLGVTASVFVSKLGIGSGVFTLWCWWFAVSVIYCGTRDDRSDTLLSFVLWIWSGSTFGFALGLFNFLFVFDGLADAFVDEQYRPDDPSAGIAFLVSIVAGFVSGATCAILRWRRRKRAQGTTVTTTG